MRKTVLRYKDADGSRPYSDWFSKLKDGVTKNAVEDRIERARDGNFGDWKPLKDGAIELRLDHGPGYRVYVGQLGDGLLVLLHGGTKNGQAADIKIALACWNEWKTRNV